MCRRGVSNFPPSNKCFDMCTGPCALFSRSTVTSETVNHSLRAATGRSPVGPSRFGRSEGPGGNRSARMLRTSRISPGEMMKQIAFSKDCATSVLRFPAKDDGAELIESPLVIDASDDNRDRKHRCDLTRRVSLEPVGNSRLHRRYL